jgi:hypothetical protein
MIKVNELRIGNLISYKNKKVGYVSNITTMFPDINHIRISGQREFYYNLKYIKPIPLTVGWLLKFGFEKAENDYRIQIQKDDGKGNTDYWIWVSTGINNETNKFNVLLVSQEGDWFNSKNKYVHQLQNLYFGLTGDELKIKKQK